MSPEYTAFEKKLFHISTKTKEEDPHLIAVAKTLPAVAEALRTLTRANEAAVTVLDTRLLSFERELQLLTQSQGDFLGGRWSFEFTPRRSRMMPQGIHPPSRESRMDSPSPMSSSPLPPPL